jgi:thioredoxin 1
MLERLLIAVLAAAAVFLIGLAARRLARRRVSTRLGQVLPAGVRDRLPGSAPSLLYFFGPHCASCRLQGQVIDTLESRLDIRALRINADEEREVAAWFGILTVPSTVVVGEDGTVRQTLLGFQPGRVIEDTLRAPAVSSEP